MKRNRANNGQKITNKKKGLDTDKTLSARILSNTRVLRVYGIIYAAC